nr:NlpC/P60 family protein [Corallococcus soli]
MWDACKSVASVANLQPGDLMLYGKAGDPDHVMVHVGAGVVVGASGGGRRTLTLEGAARLDAKVKAFARPEYRPDILGFRRLPFVS